MRNRKEYLILLSAGGMEFAWIFAVVAFIFSLAEWPLLPVFEVIGTFWLAAILTFLTLGKGWRIITVLAIQLAGFIIVMLRIVYVYSNWSTPFFGREWLVELGDSLKGPTEWFILIMMVFSGVILWWGGFALARREQSFNNLCNRFDLGIGIFFFLLFIGAGIGVASQAVNLLLMPFFFAGMLTIALARNRGIGQKSFLLGFRGIGLMLTFIGLVFLIVVAVISFFFPYLTIAAEAGYMAMRAATEPLAPYLINLILFFFRFGNRPRTVEEPQSDAGNIDGALELVGEYGQGHLLEKIIGWGLFSIVGLIGIALISWGLWRLLHLLLRPTMVNREQKGLFSRFLAWVSWMLNRVVNYWHRIREKIFRAGRGRGSEVERLYRQLEKWGQASGLPSMPWETPSEYGMRLGLNFPDLKKEIKLVIDGFNQEVYGGGFIEKNKLALVKMAWNNITNPRNWPARIKMRFFT